MLCDDRLPAAAARYTGVMASLALSRGPRPVLILPLLALDMSLQKGRRGSISVSDMETVYGVQFKPINLVSMLDDLTDADALIN